MVLANGMSLGSEEVVAALEQSPPWASYEMIDERLIEIDSSNVLLVYEATALRPDGSSFTAAMSSLYHRVGGEGDGRGWELVLYQQTPILSD
jgi:hypothetical protein